MTSTTRLIGLSHIIDDGMITYAGLPGPTICDFWSRIVEHMTNLGALPSRGFRFTAAPPLLFSTECSLAEKPRSHEGRKVGEEETAEHSSLRSLLSAPSA